LVANLLEKIPGLPGPGEVYTGQARGREGTLDEARAEHEAREKPRQESENQEWSFDWKRE
jgi:hypothetical protein